MKNYHRLYLRGLKDKAKAVSEKELAKIQQLIPPGIGTDHNVNIYVFLRKKAAIRDIRIPIVETLFVSKKNRTAVYMGNSSSGKITLIEKETAYKEFFLALSQGYNCNEPVCIYKPYEGKNILFECIETVQSFLSISPNIEGVLQKFLHPVGGRSYFLRVHWKLRGEPRGFLISNIESNGGSTSSQLQACNKSIQNPQNYHRPEVSGQEKAVLCNN